jgi:hypothetical protein
MTLPEDIIDLKFIKYTTVKNLQIQKINIKKLFIKLLKILFIL